MINYFNIVVIVFISFCPCILATCASELNGEILSHRTDHKRHAISATNFPARDDTITYRSYQKSIYCTPTQSIQYPRNVTELTEIVKKNIADGFTVKAIGGRYSITDIICTGGVPISLQFINHATDNEDETVSFGAGIKLVDALLYLEEKNKTLIHVPAYGGISLGGALGTGAHGSSLLHPTSISDQVVRLIIVDGTGNLREIREPEEVNAFRVHLGLLGIVVEVTVSTVALFRAHVETKLEPESILMDGTALRWANSLDWVQMWWFPSTKNVVVLKGSYAKNSLEYLGNATSQFIPEMDSAIITTGNLAYETLQATKNKPGLYAVERFTELSLHKGVIGKPPLFSEDGIYMKNPANGIAWRLMSNICRNLCPWENGNYSILPEESSVALHISKLQDAVTTIKNVLKITPVAFSMVGIFIRFSKSSDAPMAISSGRPTVTLEWASQMRSNPYDTPSEGITAYQAILQSLIHHHGGRPHWGKNGLHYFTRTILQKTTDLNKLDAFKFYMKKYDPRGVFLNKFGRRILGQSDEMDIDPQVHHCALQAYCICSKSEDCAPFQHCTRANTFPVCRDIIDINDSNYDPANLTSLLYAVGALFQEESFALTNQL